MGHGFMRDGDFFFSKKNFSSHSPTLKLFSDYFFLVTSKYSWNEVLYDSYRLLWLLMDHWWIGPSDFHFKLLAGRWSSWHMPTWQSALQAWVASLKRFLISPSTASFFFCVFFWMIYQNISRSKKIIVFIVSYEPLVPQEYEHEAACFRYQCQIRQTSDGCSWPQVLLPTQFMFFPGW